jgi:serine/threonine-protein kinase
MFGAMAGFFAYAHFVVFYHHRVLDMATDEDSKILLFSAFNAGNCLRWFILIVLYGTFIPNTWKRCALVVGGMALLPLGLSVWIGCECPLLGPFVWHGMFEMVVILAIASTIAIFGSYKISELQQQAFVARKLGQYVLHRKLGAGGMGEVYLGEHTMLRRSCAIKLIRPEQAGDPTTLSRFEREVQAMATLTHWNTVEVYDYGLAEDGTFYYVMEYLPGLSLQDLVERHGPLPPGRAIYILRQLCAALKEAHAIGLIHRDIKPSNVILCQRGGAFDVAKLLDFGLVQGFGFEGAPDRLTLQGTILGSPPYMSPEQALGKGQIDARTDIYSLGGLAYFLLTGQPPFQRETAMEMLMAHVHDNVPPLREIRPEVPPDLEEVVLQCLAKKADERFPNIHRVDRALADCAAADDWESEQAKEWWDETRGKREPMLAG